MIFSFFVAVTVTPWLMLKVAGGAPAAAHDAHADGGALGRIYAAVARPLLRSKARSWLFLLVVGALTLGSLSLFYTKHVTVKLLPFDNKSELSGGRRPARGLLGRGHRRRGAGGRSHRAGAARGALGPGPRRHRRALQLQRPRAPFLPARDARAGRRRNQPPAQGRARSRQPRHRARHPPASRRTRRAARHQPEGGRAAARAAGARDAARRDLRP